MANGDESTGTADQPSNSHDDPNNRSPTMTNSTEILDSSMAKIMLKPLDDGQKSVDIPVGKTTIGRGPFLGCGDKRVSRNHAVFEVTEKGEVFLTPTHVNPCFYRPTAESPGAILEKGKRHRLENGDSFSLLPRAFRYQVFVVGEIIEEKLDEISDAKLENNANGSTDERKPKEESKTVCGKEDINRLKAECASEDSSDAKEAEDSSDAKEAEDSSDAKESEDSSDAKEAEDSSDVKESEDSSDAKESEDAKVNSSSSGDRNSGTLPVWLEKLVDNPNKQEKKKPRAAKLQNRERPSKHKAENSVKRKIAKTYDKSESDDGEWQSDKAEPKLKKRRGRRRGNESGNDWEAEHGKKKRSHKYDSDSESGSDWGASIRRRKTSKIKRRRSKRVAVSEGGSDEEMEEDTSSAVKNSKRILCTKESPNFLMFGRDLNIPGELMKTEPSVTYKETKSYAEDLVTKLQVAYQIVSDNLETAAESARINRARTATDKHIKVGELVYLFTPKVGRNQTKKLSRLSSGPFRVLSQTSPVNFVIAPVSDMRKRQLVHVDRIFRVPERRAYDTWEFVEEREESRKDFAAPQKDERKNSTGETPERFDEDDTGDEDWYTPMQQGGTPLRPQPASRPRRGPTALRPAEQRAGQVTYASLRDDVGVDSQPIPYLLRPRDADGRVVRFETTETDCEETADPSLMENRAYDAQNIEDEGTNYDSDATEEYDIEEDFRDPKSNEDAVACIELEEFVNSDNESKFAWLL